MLVRALREGTEALQNRLWASFDDPTWSDLVVRCRWAPATATSDRLGEEPVVPGEVVGPPPSQQDEPTTKGQGRQAKQRRRRQQAEEEEEEEVLCLNLHWMVVAAWSNVFGQLLCQPDEQSPEEGGGGGSGHKPLRVQCVEFEEPSPRGGGGTSKGKRAGRTVVELQPEDPTDPAALHLLLSFFYTGDLIKSLMALLKPNPPHAAEMGTLPQWAPHRHPREWRYANLQDTPQSLGDPRVVRLLARATRLGLAYGVPEFEHQLSLIWFGHSINNGHQSSQALALHQWLSPPPLLRPTPLPPPPPPPMPSATHRWSYYQPPCALRQHDHDSGDGDGSEPRGHQTTASPTNRPDNLFDALVAAAQQDPLATERERLLHKQPQQLPSSSSSSSFSSSATTPASLANGKGTEGRSLRGSTERRVPARYSSPDVELYKGTWETRRRKQSPSSSSASASSSSSVSTHAASSPLNDFLPSPASASMTAQAPDTKASVRTHRSSQVKPLEHNVGPNKRKREPSLEASVAAPHAASAAAPPREVSKSKRQKRGSDFMNHGLGTYSKQTGAKDKAQGLTKKDSSVLQPVRRSARAKSAPLRDAEATEEHQLTSLKSTSPPNATRDSLHRLDTRARKDGRDYAMESSADSPLKEGHQERKRKKKSEPSAVGEITDTEGDEDDAHEDKRSQMRKATKRRQKVVSGAMQTRAMAANRKREVNESMSEEEESPPRVIKSKKSCAAGSHPTRSKSLPLETSDELPSPRPSGGPMLLTFLLTQTSSAVSQRKHTLANSEYEDNQQSLKQLRKEHWRNCHNCKTRKINFLSCPVRETHRFCAGCLKKLFNIEYARVSEWEGLTKEGCPICRRACPCVGCRKKQQQSKSDSKKMKASKRAEQQKATAKDQQAASRGKGEAVGQHSNGTTSQSGNENGHPAADSVAQRRKKQQSTKGSNHTKSKNNPEKKEALENRDTLAAKHKAADDTNSATAARSALRTVQINIPESAGPEAFLGLVSAGSALSQRPQRRTTVPSSAADD